MTYTTIENIRLGFLLTAGWLRHRRACPIQRELFEKIYPEGMRISTRNLNIARSKHRLNVRRLIETVLSWDERARLLYKYTGANPRVVQWSKKNARLFHAAFIKILKERGQ